MRRYTRKIQIGKISIGGDSPISVQSMTKTRTSDIDATVAQIQALEQVGCDIVRVAVPDVLAARSISSIKKQIKIPIVADIHFDHRLAILAIEAGADKVRINPGNLGRPENIQNILRKATDRNIPIRIGVNAGSIEKDLLKKYGRICSEALIDSVMRHIRICEKLSFKNLIVSVKSSDVNMMIDAYRKISSKVDYPLHLGVTEAGTEFLGVIKSAIGIGTLLQEGIGDTIRVSLTTDPIQEVEAGINILRALNLRSDGIVLTACPTCGRTKSDLLKIVREVEANVNQIKKTLKIAVMGCEVNGPGEAREADIGIACSGNYAILYKKGKPLRKISNQNIVSELLTEISKF